MTEQQHNSSQPLSLVAPNPQGKGLVPVLDHLSGARHIVAQAKNPAECLLDYLVSALVLSANFRFKPVSDRAYFLYYRDGWQLSLVSPEQWGDSGLRQSDRVFVGRCRMRTDFTWQMDQVQPLDEHEHIIRALEEFETLFRGELGADQSMSDLLPFHRSSLPFWQRIHAHALAKSLKSSMISAGLDEWTGPQMLANAGSSIPSLNHLAR